MMAVLRVARPQRPIVRLWLPLFLLWLLALPVAIVALPLAAVIVAACGRNSVRMVAAYWNVLCALSGSHIEVQRRHRRVCLHVY